MIYPTILSLVAFFQKIIWFGVKTLIRLWIAGGLWNKLEGLRECLWSCHMSKDFPLLLHIVPLDSGTESFSWRNSKLWHLLDWIRLVGFELVSVKYLTQNKLATSGHPRLSKAWNSLWDFIFLTTVGGRCSSSGTSSLGFWTKVDRN